jgi:N-acetylglutamate synthase-like GNAT family acetyltransferase
LPTIHIRPATESDQAQIKALVRGEGLDPTALHWSHFLIAEDGGQTVGIGQIRPYPNCRELGSLVVVDSHREQGIGGLLIEALLKDEAGPVYLECLAFREAYYSKFGFRRVPWWQTPMPLKLKAGVGGTLGRLFGYRVIAMKR